MKVDTCICGDIVNELPLAQPTVSQHLKELKTLDLLKAALKVTQFVTALTEKALSKLQSYFTNIF